MPIDHTSLASIGARLKQVRQQQSLTQKEFAALVGIEQSTLSQMENGSIRPSLEVLSGAVQLFGVSFDFLLLAQGQLGSGRPKPQVDSKDLLPLVDQKVLAGTQLGFADADPLAQLPYISFPGMAGGVAVRVQGNSMAPTLHEGDILLCAPVEQELFRDNLIYVIVTREGALVKRVLDRSRTEQVFVLKSDNRDYSIQMLRQDEVLRMYTVRRRITADLSGPDKLYDRITDIEHSLLDLRAAYERLDQRLH